MPPEALVDGLFTSQSDVWAFGVLLWEVMTLGEQPYQARNNIEVLNLVKSGRTLDKPDGCPEELYHLMQQCWAYRPIDRPSFKYCLDSITLLQSRVDELLNEDDSLCESKATSKTVSLLSHAHAPGSFALSPSSQTASHGGEDRKT
ncbi:unnamed protein product, partial [Cyprideis torosa]